MKKPARNATEEIKLSEVSTPAESRPAGAGITARVSWVLLLAAVTAALLYLFYVQQFTYFAGYDDEGYILLSLRQFMQGHPLYDYVFTQYGPFHFLFKSCLHLLTFSAATHDTTRLITVGTRFFVSATCAYFFFTATRNALLAVLLYINMAVFLRSLVNEPGHPQETVLLLLCMALWAVLLTARRLPPRLSVRHAMVVGGALSGAMLLTKINIGVFFCLACLTILLNATPHSRWDRVMRRALAGLILVIPLLTMYAHAFFGVFNYLLVATLSIFLVATANLRFAGNIPFKRAWLQLYFLGLAISMVIILVPVFLMGTTVDGLVAGLIVEPARFSSQFYGLLTLPAAGVAMTLVMTALGVQYLNSHTLLGLPAEHTHKLVAALKIALGIWGLQLQGTSAMIAFLPGTLWLLPAGLKNGQSSPRARIVRLVLMNLAVFQILQAYPVAGSQQTWATFLLLISCYLFLHDGWEALTLNHSPSASPEAGRVAIIAVWCAATMFFFYDASGIAALIDQFQTSANSKLRGANRLRIPAPQDNAYEYIATAVKDRCDTMVTMPGVLSLNIWSGVNPPTGWNATAWMTLIGSDKQQEVVRKLRKSPAPCAVVCESCMGMWLRGQDISGKPLVQYINSELTPLTSYGAFELRVAKNTKLHQGSVDILSGQFRFDGVGQVVNAPGQALFQKAPVSVRLWFQSESPGGLLGAQNIAYPHESASEWAPLLYIGLDEKLHGGFFTQASGVQNASAGPRVTDRRWHHVVLVKQVNEQTLYLDGALIGRLGPPLELNMGSFQFGAAFTRGWPSGADGWLRLKGTIRDAVVFDAAWGSTEVMQDLSASKPASDPLP